MEDEFYMQLALELAEMGRGWVNPNPMVGAVIVKDGRIIGRGYHRRYGELHAERNALADCKEDPKGATMYVTLEPCCHYGKTPPCTEAVVAYGIKRVVIGAMDINPEVSGKGAMFLREHGIEVRTGVLQEACEQLNKIFFHYMRTGMPYVVYKYAMTLDGKTATHTGESRWISGEQARAQVHEIRHQLMGIMVGNGTVQTDDPHLDCRKPNGRDPIRIICDTHLGIPLTSYVVQTAKEQPTIIATACEDSRRCADYQSCGCEILQIPTNGGHLDLKALMCELGKRKIDSILLEGGAQLGWAALEAGIVNEIRAYIAPKLFGGTLAATPLTGKGVALPEEAFLLRNVMVRQIDTDILVTAEVEERRC